MDRNHLTEFELYIEDINSAIDKMLDKGSLTYETRIRAGVKIKDECFRKGYVNVHIPIPQNNSRVSEGMILDATPVVRMYALDNHRQRTAFFSEYLEENTSFEIEYDYTYGADYIDTSERKDIDTEQPVFSPEAIAIFNKRTGCDCGAEHAKDENDSIINSEPKPRIEDVAEDGKSIIFTDRLKSLCAEITKDCTCNYDKAKAIYDYITMNIRYSFVEDYIKLDNITEYALINKEGDCGLMSLLFIILCRIAGVPARWQSGLFTAPGAQKAGPHDWAMFYIAPYGWLYADLAFGALAYEKILADEQKEKDIDKQIDVNIDKGELCSPDIDYDKIRNFYFGNIEPFRMPANSAFEKPFYPAKLYTRADPYDNQYGEIEYEDRGLTSEEYTGWAMIKEQKEI